ncbi:uncharacterized protein LOC124888859 [Capsicum annuum]|uniref:uncharacterized protein LOC124888859 n=1 Tax=Capsicum annuum TaxID=4072 RepID=UPI001FB14581|nr:uncharacterized protein LOC124888859 [Capsicum annuum]
MDDALWVYKTAYKIPIGTSFYRLVYGKVNHLHVELEHQACWAVKKLNLYIKATEEKRLFQLNELDKFRLHAYENARLYKERTKRWHDKHIVTQNFKLGQLVLLFNARLKLRSNWSRLFEVVRMTPHEVFELWTKNKSEKLLVNGQRVKHYWADHGDQHNMCTTFADE